MSIGKYCLGSTIGEGTFAKVKLAVDVHSNQQVAIKIIDKQMVVKNKLMYQVKREISTMKRLNHPNIVKIYEVIATKTKIYLVMEYVSGGELSDKMNSGIRLSEKEARKYFQQLIDAVDYCHTRGVFHRDLKPDNLLLDAEGNLKVSDFGLSVLRKPGSMLTTACGSPSYVAPEVITDKRYDGAAADVWSCGVVLFELLTDRPPFEDSSLTKLYQKITRAEYTCPTWLTDAQRNLISRILDPSPQRRATIAEIYEDDWFHTDYELPAGIQAEQSIKMDIEKCTKTAKGRVPDYINAFQLITMSNGLNLSSFFQEQETTRLGSKHSVHETIEKIESAAKATRLTVNKMNSFKVKLHENKRWARNVSQFTVSVEVIQVTPTDCMIEVSKSQGNKGIFEEFCRSLSSLLKNCGNSSSTKGKRPRQA